MPGMAPEETEAITDAVDPELRADEQSFVRHYLGYADTLLRNCDETLDDADSSAAPISAASANVTQMPKLEEKEAKTERAEPSKDDGKNNAA